jgi:replicative DNA helicase
MDNKGFTPQESEEAILHIVMNSPDRYFSLSNLRAYMFSVPALSEIYKLIKEANDGKVIPDPHIITQMAEGKGVIDEAGGREYLTKIRDLKGINPDNIKAYEMSIISAWKARGVISICSLTPSEIDNVANIDSTILGIRKQLDKLDENTSSDSIVSLESVAEEVWERMKLKKSDPGISGISTGWKGLDRLTAGKDGGELWFISGRPGMGKTAMILNMLATDAKQDKKALLFSLEMKRQILVERLLAIETGIHLYPNIRMGNLDDEQLEVIRSALGTFKLYPIFLDTSFIASLDYLEMMIRKYKHSEDIDVVYVDYVQLLAERDADATQALGRISRRCKLLAEEYDIPIVIASQLNRSVEARTNKRPVLSDLRQSGNLEEDADVVLGLYRDKKYNTQTPDPRLTECLIIKQRNGPTGTVWLDFEEETNRFRDKEGFYDDKQAEAEGVTLGEGASPSIERRVDDLGL